MIIAIIAIAIIVALFVWHPWSAGTSNTTIVNPPSQSQQSNPGRGTSGSTSASGSMSGGSAGTSGSASGSGSGSTGSHP